MGQPAAFAVCHVVGAEWDEFFLRSGYMNTAALQPLKIEIPRILKSHSGYAEGMALDLIQEAVEWIRVA